MTRDEIVETVKRRLGNRGGTAQDVNVQGELRSVQETLESHAFHPWFLLTEVESASTTTGEERLPVPVDFLAEYEEGSLYVFDAALTNPWIPVCKVDLAEMHAEVTGTGQPKAYTLTNQYFRLAPTPDKTYNMRMLYYAKDLPLTSNITNKWTGWAAELLINRTAEQMARNFRMDAETIRRLEFTAERALIALKHQHNQRNFDNRSYVMRDSL